MALPITLWACVRSDDQEYWCRTARVLRYCSRLFDFERIVLFSFLPPMGDVLPLATEVFQIPQLDIDQFNIWVNKGAPDGLLENSWTEHYMSVHEDGFILNPHVWDERFLDYDFIGAPWYDKVVGNGAFCIESRRLMEKKASLPFYKRLDQPYDGRWFLPSDVYICREHRQTLIDAGYAFAPFEIAETFAVEQTKPQFRPSFGFHGRRCRPECYERGWELIEQQEDIFRKERT